MDDINLELPNELPDMPSRPMIADGGVDDPGTGTGSGSGSGAPAAASEGKDKAEKAMTETSWKKAKELVDQGLSSLKQLQTKVEKMVAKMPPNDS